MPFVKTTKSNAYFKRFQTKFRRRRIGKTDYYARKRMVCQALNKYGIPKYRLVSRITQHKVIAQIVYSMQKGDFCICQANSKELQKLGGLETGFTSYPAAYATGLLLARRLLEKLGMANLFGGVTEADGKDYDVSADPNCVKLSRKPFKAILDIGLQRSTVGNRVFGVLKGACDGGLHIPHSIKKYPGYSYDKDSKKGEYNAEFHCDRIFGCHIDEYMTHLKEKSEDEYQKQFRLWDKCLKTSKSENVEALFTKLHEKIRSSPKQIKAKHDKKKVNYTDKNKTLIKTSTGTYLKNRRLTYAQKKANLQTKLDMIKN